MTAQISDNLIVESPDIDLIGMYLHGIYVGSDILDYRNRSSYKFNAQGDKSKFTMCTALWRGYISTYLLNYDGTLTLIKMEYPFTDGADPDFANEKLSGDFWMDMRPSFFGGSLYVPFESGHVVLDTRKWVRLNKKRHPSSE